MVCPGGVYIDPDDLVRACDASALHDVEADASENEDDDRRARLHLRGVDDRADAGRDAAADVTDLVEGGVLADLRDRDLRQHGVLGERRAAHVVVDLGLADREAARPVGHEPLALRGADRGAEVRLARQARFALPTLRCVEQDDVVPLLHADVTLRANVDDHLGALVAEDRREEPLGVGTRARELIGVADARGLELHEHFAQARGPSRSTVSIDERLPLLIRDGSAGLHGARCYTTS